MEISGYEVTFKTLSEEDGGGVAAYVPALPGCMTDGETKDEAAANVPEAIRSWLAMAYKMGRQVPQPAVTHA